MMKGCCKIMCAKVNSNPKRNTGRQGNMLLSPNFEGGFRRLTKAKNRSSGNVSLVNNVNGKDTYSLLSQIKGWYPIFLPVFSMKGILAI